MTYVDRRRDSIHELGRLGFSLYEARAYVALLESQPANGYDLARTSGIPTSKIYETLQRLVARGAALASASEPIVYRAVSPDELIADFRQQSERTLRVLSNTLPRIAALPAAGVVWRLRGYEPIVRHLLSIATDASEELYLSLWPDEAAHLAQPIAAARQRGVRIWVASLGPSPLAGEGVYNLLSCATTSSARLGRRLTAAVADDGRALVAEFSDDAEPTGTLTDDPCLALVVKEFIVHDILGEVLIDALGQDRIAALQCQHPRLANLLAPAVAPVT